MVKCNFRHDQLHISVDQTTSQPSDLHNRKQTRGHSKLTLIGLPHFNRLKKQQNLKFHNYEPVARAMLRLSLRSFDIIERVADALHKVASALPAKNWTCRDTVTSAPVSPVWLSALLFTWCFECVTSISIVMKAVSRSGNVFKVKRICNSFRQKRNSSPVDCNGERSGAVTSCAAHTGKSYFLLINERRRGNDGPAYRPAAPGSSPSLQPMRRLRLRACVHDAYAPPCVKRAQLPE